MAGSSPAMTGGVGDPIRTDTTIAVTGATIILLAGSKGFGQARRVNESLPETAPVELRVATPGTALAILWADGSSVRLAAAVLRQACRCASCTAARATGKPVEAAANIAIAAVQPIGGYAVNIAFSDGHARGIYPWGFLREIAAAWPEG